MQQLIVFVRHGESQANVRGILSDYKDRFPLTREGILQAKTTATELRKLRLTAIFSSPVLRARQTAGIISNELHLPITIDKRLWERRMHSLNGSKSGSGAYVFESDAKFESTASVYKRTVAFVNDQSADSIVAVAHMVQQQSLAFKSFGFNEFTGFPFRPSYASMTILVKNGRKLRIIAAGIPEINSSVLSKIPKRFIAEV
jgi:probable phosphoglycerate mutase